MNIHQKTLTFTVQLNENEDFLRLDKFLASKRPDLSRQFFQKLVKQNFVFLNNNSVTKNKTPLKHGDNVIVILDENFNQTNLIPENISQEILYEDEFIIVINKPRNRVVHPGAGNFQGTVANGLLFYINGLKEEFMEEPMRPGIIHRLDKDTSGLLIAAKTQKAKIAFSNLFSSKQIKKHYLAICLGPIKESVIETFIGRNPKNRKLMTVLENKGKKALTNCFPLCFSNNFSLVKIQPITGRTHQIRVHLQHIGHPILGDPIYGFAKINKQYKIFQQLLHAFKIEFVHPMIQKPLAITAPLPKDMVQFSEKYFSGFDICAL